jgi:hypothetical protein
LIERTASIAACRRGGRSIVVEIRICAVKLDRKVRPSVRFLAERPEIGMDPPIAPAVCINLKMIASALAVGEC